jgi:fumarate hydratase class I
MGAKALGGRRQHGAVYLSAIGGAGQFYAHYIDWVDGVSLAGLERLRRCGIYN